MQILTMKCWPNVNVDQLNKGFDPLLEHETLAPLFIRFVPYDGTFTHSLLLK